MLIGDTEDFAIECHHDPRANDRGWVFGRMCVWARGRRLGDLDEPSCLLNVTEGFLQGLPSRIEFLDDPGLGGLSDYDAFTLLDNAIYLDDDRSLEEVKQDAERFRKFDFLTNGGESFDRTKSFIVGDGDDLRILFRNEKDQFVSARIARSSFMFAVRGFLAWISSERGGTG